MEDGDGDGEDRTPFWVQSPTNARRADLLRRRLSAAFFSSGLLVFLLLVTSILFLVFAVPSSISLSTRILKPNSVRKSWDSLNIVLVLVAVVFGFLSRNKNEDRFNSYYDEFPIKEIGSQKSSNSGSKYNYETNEGSKSNSNSNSSHSHWFEYSDYPAKSEHKNPIFTRNSSSYPDLREISNSHWSYDDILVDSGRVWDPEMDRSLGESKIHRRHRSLGGVELLRPPMQNITPDSDTLLSKSEEAPNFETEEVLKMGVSESEAAVIDGSSMKLENDFQPSDHVTEPPPPQPTPEAEMEMELPELTENPELAYERMGRKKERSNRKRNQFVQSNDPVSTSPPRQKSAHRKRSGSTGSSTKDFLNSLYSKKKKKQRQKSVDHLDHLLHKAQASLSFQVPPPSHPPPPPPALPPASVFQNLFSSKKHKRKRTITVTLAPQPSSSTLVHEPEPEPTFHIPPPTTQKPPKPVKMISFDKSEEVSNSGGDSPVTRIPPPPPLPPAAFLKSPAWKFVVQGDYVRINSSNSSRSGSPDDVESDVTPSAVDAAPQMFCASPDVDTKAESFITNFRATLKLEKIHSMKKRDLGPSGLGPSQFSRKD